MAAVLTITLSPSLDTWTTTERLVPEAKLRCTMPLQHPGGGGINVARVLHRLGTDVLALHVASGPTGAALAALLEQEHLPVLAVPGAGDTRRAWTVAETGTGREYRFVPPGPALPPSAIEAITRHLATLQPAPAMVVLSGSLPSGSDGGLYADLARSARAHGGCGRQLPGGTGPRDGAWPRDPRGLAHGRRRGRGHRDADRHVPVRCG